MSSPVCLAFIGPGSRGHGIFWQYALDAAHRASFTTIVEPDATKSERFSARHDIPGERRFTICDYKLRRER